MNAKLLERLVAYREARGLEVAGLLLAQKVRYQFASVKSTGESAVFTEQLRTANTIQKLLLIEARAARAYWARYGRRISRTAPWLSRRPHNGDPCNHLLDIGYHYLAGRIATLCRELNVPTELGLFHRAQSARAEPLVYDIMEWLRPVLVDAAVLAFFTKKKHRVERITERDIGRTLASIKKRFERRYYHRRLGYCITLAYWSKLILLEFERCVRGKKPFRPIFPSLRHETRCKKESPRAFAGR